jgi:putative transposase
LYVITDAVPESYTKTHDGASVGIDFGLKTYLTLSNGDKLQNPQFLKRDLKKVSKADHDHSTKAIGSNNREKARIALDRLHEHISNCRSDFQWKLSHELCRRYDYIFIKDLNLQGMTKLWGRKMNDLAHGQFVRILCEVATKYGCTVHKIDRWFPSSKLCDCGYINKSLTLSDREWVCPECGQIHDRDVHAAEMILRRGVYELTSGSETNEVTAEGHSAFATLS